MAYNGFKKMVDLRKRLGLNDAIETWLPKTIKPVPAISSLLKAELDEAVYEALTTEKAKSESIIVPIIKELRRKNTDKFSFFSGFEFNVDASKGLKGYCDFILSSDIKRSEISAPIFCVVEAKDGKVEKGLAQCGAEMYAAQIYNQQAGKPKKAIYGTSTNAYSWAFLKLEGLDLFIDPNYVPLTFAKPHEVLGVLQWILDESLKPGA